MILYSFFLPFHGLFSSAKKTNRVTMKKRGKSLLAPFLPLIEKLLHAINNAAVQRSGATRSNSANLHKQYLSTLLFLFANPNVSEYKCFITSHSELTRPPAGSVLQTNCTRRFAALLFFFPKRKQSVPASLAEQLKINCCD